MNEYLKCSCCGQRGLIPIPKYRYGPDTSLHRKSEIVELEIEFSSYI